MALPILDGNQTSTTLATTVSGGAHYPNHIIASGTVTANVNGSIIGEGYNSLYDLINDGGLIVNSIANPVTIGSIPAISGTVTANDFSEWQEISTRYWKADQSDWIINVSQYSAIRLYIDGDNTASISNGFWIRDAGDTYCEQDYIIWNGRSSVNSFPLADCTPVLDANVHYNYVKFTGSEPMSGATTILYGKKTRILDGLTNYQLRESPISISGTVTANVVGQHQTDENQRPIPVDSWQTARADTTVDLIVPVQITNDSGTLNASNPLPISGTVTASIANSITVGSLPVQLSTTTIGGTARLNVTLSSATTVGATAPSYANLYGGSDGANLRAISVDSSGRTVVTGTTSILGTSAVTFGAVTGSVSILGTPSVTMGAISGTVTASVSSTTVTVSALPSGALTTRFGSVTTANLAQISTAVTNNSRKYLLIQNITTASNAITIGVGFTPTTTQGIQLVAGAGITFESSYIPTGAVYVLSSVTASAFTILEA